VASVTRSSNAAVAIGSLVTERDWQQQLIQLAELLDYEYLHVRPAMRQSGRWSTPISGGLGVGWPDLAFAKPGRFLLVECKAQDGRLTPAQRAVHEALRAAGLEVHTWRPSDVDLAAHVLRGEPQ
jgi:hypothetical protein